MALEAHADRARRALACLYSSSDEFEAEVIETRRRAGDYGSRRPRLVAAVAIATAVLVAVALVIPF